MKRITYVVRSRYQIQRVRIAGVVQNQGVVLGGLNTAARRAKRFCCGDFATGAGCVGGRVAASCGSRANRTVVATSGQYGDADHKRDD